LDATRLPDSGCKLCNVELHREAVKVDRMMGLLERCDPEKMDMPIHHSWWPLGGSGGQERRITMLVIEHIS
jgi:hypothetical protein